MSNPRFFTSFALLLLASNPVMATDGYFSHGYGIKAQGIGGVGMALPQDGLAAATNPAGTAFLKDRVDIGLSYNDSGSSDPGRHLEDRLGQ